MHIEEKTMKLKMTLTYGEEICDCLKKQFGCETDQELLVSMKAVMKASMAQEAIDPEDLDIVCELVE